MDILTLWALLLTSLLGIFSCLLIMALLKITNRLAEVNKQLMILVAGKEAKPEALRALIASAKPPQGNLRGISTGKTDDKGPKNMNYTMEIGAN